MGMFDEVLCDYPLPDTLNSGTVFQTKSLDNVLDKYTITSEGELIRHIIQYDYVEEVDRPLYGTKTWKENSISKFCGCLKGTFKGYEKVEWTGELYFYCFTDKNYIHFVEYKALFLKGNLIEIQKLEQT